MRATGRHIWHVEKILSGLTEFCRWKALISESTAAIEQHLRPEIDVELASFIRCITFRVFLVVFLNVNPHQIDTNDVLRVTASLSDFYDDRNAGPGGRRPGTGGGQTRTRSNSKLPEDVQNILRPWLSRTGAGVRATSGRRPSSQSNLDRALPAYEALWRIIATIVVTCEDDESRALRWVMLDFRDNPWDRQYGVSFGGGKSASTITDDVVGHLGPITHLKQPQPTIPIPSSEPSSSLMNCIHCAFTGGSASEPAMASSSSPEHSDTPTVLEALKFAALLASMVIGRVGIKYEISPSEGVRAGDQAPGPPWDRRKLRGPLAGLPPYASGSRQAHSH